MVDRFIYFIFICFLRFGNIPRGKKLTGKRQIKYLLNDNRKYTYWSRERGYVIVFYTEYDMIAWDLTMPNFVNKSDKNSFFRKNEDRFDRQKELRAAA